MTLDRQAAVVRYWGSHFKSRRQAQVFAAEFVPIRARGWRCHLVLERLPEDPGWLQELLGLGVRIECEPRPRANLDWQCVRRVYRLCRRTRATVLHCDNMHASPLLGAYLARVPVRLWSKRAMNAHFEQCRKPTLRERLAPITRLSGFLSTRILAVARPVQQELVSLGVPARKILVRHNPRRLGTIPRDVSRGDLRVQWGFAEDDVVIVTVGHAVPVKGWDVLLSAFARILPAAPRARLLLVGSCSSREEKPFSAKLEGIVTEHNLADRVQFTGYLGEVHQALRAADIYVSPSRSEGFSNVLIEALEAGLPCVATRVGIAESVIQPARNGLLVERNDEAALAAALGELVGNDSLRDQCARHAQVPSCIPTLEEYAKQLALDYESSLAAAR